MSGPFLRHFRLCLIDSIKVNSSKVAKFGSMDIVELHGDILQPWGATWDPWSCYFMQIKFFDIRQAYSIWYFKLNFTLYLYPWFAHCSNQTDIIQSQQQNKVYVFNKTRGLKLPPKVAKYLHAIPQYPLNQILQLLLK